MSNKPRYYRHRLAFISLVLLLVVMLVPTDRALVTFAQDPTPEPTGEPLGGETPAPTPEIGGNSGDSTPVPAETPPSEPPPQEEPPQEIVAPEATATEEAAPVVVEEPLVAGFNAAVFPDGSIQFTDLTQATIVQWAWSFGDGFSSAEKDPVHVYAGAGSYTVSLTVTDDQGRTATAIQTAIVTSVLVCGFDWSAENLVAPASVQFNNTSAGANSYSWSFGDGSSSSETSPAHVFGAGGSYAVTLVCMGQNRTVEVSAPVGIVNPPPAPQAAFSLDSAIGVAPHTVTVSDASTGEIDGWVWSFGDGNSASGQGPHSHTYSTPGTYSVTLSVSNLGGSASATQQVVVTDTGNVVDAIFSVEFINSPLGVPKTVNLVNLSRGEIIRYEWDLDGNGTVDSTEPTPSYTYSAAGSYAITLKVTGADGETSTATTVIEIVEGNPPPVASFSPSTSQAVLPATVQFWDESENVIADWLWVFPDGSTSTEQNPSYTFTAAGVYSVSLTVTGPGGSDSTAREITITHPPMVYSCEILPAPSAGLAPLAVEFASAITVEHGRVGAIEWNFGNGETATGASAATTYSVADSYTVILSAVLEGDNGESTICSATVDISVQAADAVQAIFEATPASGKAPLEVAVLDASTGAITAWAWDFGDGSPSVEGQTPANHTYTQVGTYPITLTVTGENGQTAQTTRYVTVENDVQAALICSPRKVLVGQALSLENQSTGTITAVLWDFGDGVTASTGAVPSYSYTAEGVYTITLSVTGMMGVPSVASCQITVTNQLDALFDRVPRNQTLGQVFTPRDRSYGNITAWHWDFGDGTTSTDPLPASHSYSQLGDYTITLTVQDIFGQTDSYARRVTVRNNITAAFDAPSSVVAGAPVDVTDLSTGEITSWLWDWGDGSTSMGVAPEAHVYSAVGTYTITLTVNSAAGIPASASHEIEVVAPLTPHILATPATGFAPQTVEFVGYAEGDATDWLWTFSNGWRARGQQVRLTFTEPGIITATLTVTGPAGQASTSENVEILAVGAIRAAFTPSRWNGFAPLTVTFTDRSVGENITSWHWDFGDGQTSTDQHPFVVYSAPGVYEVKLTVENTVGKATATTTIRVYEVSSSSASFSATWLGGGSVRFTAIDGITLVGWDFGDGSTGDPTNPIEHTYTESGTYQVVLIYEDAQGNPQTVDRYISVQLPAPSTPEVTTTVAPQPVISSAATCTEEGFPVFSFSNAGFNSFFQQPYVIWDSTGAVVETGTIEIGWQETARITLGEQSGGFTFYTAPEIDLATLTPGTAAGGTKLTVYCQNPGLNLFDPIIDKIGVNIGGNQIRWTINLTNPGTTPETNIVFTDTIPDGLTIDSVTTNRGAVSIVGQDITVNIPFLNPALDPISQDTDAVQITIITTYTTPPRDGNFTNTGNVTPAIGSGNDSATVNVGAGGPNPTVTGAPTLSHFAGEQVCFEAAFVETSVAPGFGPYLVIMLDPTLNGQVPTFSFLGQPIPGTLIDGPITLNALTGNGTDPISGRGVTGEPGGVMYVVRYPVGSVVPGNPALEMNICVADQPLAPIGVPQPIRIIPGYEFGDSATGTNGPILDVGDPNNGAITPILVTFQKRNNTPEGERPPGPTWEYTYDLSIELAAGQTLTNPASFTDVLSPYWIYTGFNGVTGTCNPTPAVPTITAPPVGQTAYGGGTLTFGFTSVQNPSTTGTCTLTLTYRGYISNILCEAPNCTGALPALAPPPNEGTLAAIPNNQGVADNIQAIDNGANFIYNHPTVPPNSSIPDTDTVSAENTVFQKGVTGGSDATPGDVVTYTIDWQITDYDQVDTMIVTDTVPDGLSFNIGSATVQAGGPAVPITPGTVPAVPSCAAGAATQTLTFNVTNVTGQLAEGTAGRITYTATICQLYRATSLPVNADDDMTNTIVGNFTTDDGAQFTNDSQAAVNIEPITLTKETFSTPLNGSGYVHSESVVFRLTLTIPSGDTRNVQMIDYFPLPVFEVEDLDFGLHNFGAVGAMPVLNPTGECSTYATYFPAAAPPPAGNYQCGIYLGPDHSNPAFIPTSITTDPSNNALIINWPDIDATTSQTLQVDVVISVIDQPFADNLFLSNQLEAQAEDTPGQPLQVDAIDYVAVRAPVVEITKGVITISNPTAVIAPITNPIDGNVTNADAGDIVTYRITVRNTGGANAYNVIVDDNALTLPQLTACAMGGVRNGAGLLLTDGVDYSGDILAGTLTFDTIFSSLSGTTASTRMIDVQCRIDDDAFPTQNIINTAGATFRALPPLTGVHNPPPGTYPRVEDTATVTIASPSVTKDLLASDQAFTTGLNVAVGEIVTYEIELDIPAGDIEDVVFEDRFPAGLVFLDCVSVVAAPGLSTNLGGGFGAVCNDPTNPTVAAVGGVNGRSVIWDFGDLSNVGTTVGDGKSIVITLQAIVTNVAGNVRGTTLRNKGELRWTGATLNRLVSDTAPALTVVEPTLLLDKSVDPPTPDANDIITYTLVLSHAPGSNSDAQDVELRDVVPAGVDYVPGSLSDPTCTAPTTFTKDDSTPTVAPGLQVDIDELPIGEVCSVTFQVTLSPSAQPNTTITNTGNLAWTSIDEARIISQTPYSTVGVERTGNPANPGGALNTYRTTDPAVFQVARPEISKTIVDTSDASTTNGADADPDLAIGETVTYEISVTLPEGVTQNVRVADVFPAGVTFAVVDARLINIGGNTTAGANSGGTLSITGSTVGAAPNVPPQTWNLGTVTNTPDNDVDDGDRIVFRITARVTDVAANTGVAPAPDLDQDNTASMTYTDGNGNTDTVTDTARVDIIEPELNITKLPLVVPNPLDSGDVVTFTIRVQHTSNSRMLAHDVVVTDVIPAEMSYIGNVTAVSGPAPTVGGVAPNMTFSWATIPLGSAYEFTFQVRLTDLARSGQAISNTAALEYDTLTADNDPNERNKTASSTTSVTPSLPSIQKTIVATELTQTGTSQFDPAVTDLNIGESVTYQLTATVTEGTSTLFIDDTIPANMTALSATVVTVGCGNITGSLLNNGDTVSVAVNPVVFNFGAITNPQDNVVNNCDRIVVQIVARVNDVPANSAGVIRTNTARISPDGGGNFAPQDANDSVNIEVVEPILRINKTSATLLGDAGDAVTYTVTMTHATGSTGPAFAVDLTDALNVNLTLNVGTVSVVTCPGVCTVVTGNTVGDTTIRVTADVLPLGQSLVVQYSAQIQAGVFPGTLITNTATAPYSSHPNPAVDRLYPPVTDPHTITVTEPLFDKSVFSSNVSQTGQNQHVAGVQDLAIGEVVTYEIVMEIPEGVTPTMVMNDQLPALFELVSAQVTYVGSSLGGSLQVAVGSNNTNDPDITFVDNLPVDGILDRVNINIGTNVTNPPNSTDDLIRVRVTARVLDSNPTNVNGQSKINSATLDFGTGTRVSTVPVDIVEPNLVVDKSFSPTAAERGQTVQMPLVVTNNGTAPGFDWRLQDTVNTNLRVDAINIVLASAPSTAVVANTSTLGYGGTIDIRFNQLAVGETVTVWVTVFVSPAAPLAIIPNTATVTYDSNPGNDPLDRNYTSTDPADLNVIPPAIPARVGDLIWYDVDNDGVQDGGIETGIDGVTVRLLDSNGVVIATTITAGGGAYEFTDLPAGNYSIQVDSTTLPAGVTQTYDLDGLATPHRAAFSLLAGQNRTDVDFGYLPNASLGDFVWYDLDGDGVQDGGAEVGIPGVTVELLDALNNVVATDITDSNGAYLFDNLPPGTYSVRTVAATLPASLAQTYDLDGTGTANIATATLTPGQQRTDVDFGYRPTALGYIGDFVWYDMDGDGVQDGGAEAGIPNVTVNLLDNTGAIIATTTTSANGLYSFPNLAAGDYQVQVDTTTLPLSLLPTYDLDGGLNSLANVTLPPNGVRTDVDFGYRPFGAVGDRIWYDVDNDGVQDPSEIGIGGVTVRLLDSNGNVIRTTTTNGTGNYLFDNLPEGTYTVEVDPTTLPPSRNTPTYDRDGIGSPHRATFPLLSGQTRLDIDFGYGPSGSVGDFIWYDLDGDGVQDGGGETGIAGVTVNLFSSAGVLLATTTTDSSGFYLFDGLPGGNYRIDVDPTTLPPGHSNSFDLDGNRNSSTPFTLGDGQDRTDIDFGYTLNNGYIGDTVWYDIDGDGVQDAGEAGIPGVTVELLDAGGTVIATTTTNAGGAYAFPGLPAGTYQVRTVPATLPAGVNPSFDRDGIGTPDIASNIVLPSGGAITNVDFGYRPTGSIGDRIWADTDYSTTQNGVEAGIPNVTVRLLDAATNALIATTTTNATGDYLFDNLPAGNYVVEVVTSTLPAATRNPTFDLDGTLATPNRATVPLAAGQDRTDVDFGYAPLGSIGDFIWYDLDGDGIQDGGSEAGIPNVLVTLTGTDVLGNPVNLTTTTDANGGYLFPNLLGGNYTVTVDTASLPANLTNTGDPDGVFNSTSNVVLAQGENRLDMDFGYRPVTGYIGDFLWFDIDGDGVQDGGLEAGIPNVTLELLDAGGAVIGTTTTSPNGVYSFTGLVAGTYSVRVVPSTLPPGLTQTYDLDGIGTANIATVILPAGGVNTNLDFGYRPTGSLGDRIWSDTDGDGVQDGGEPGIAGVTVRLLDDNGNLIATTTTNGTGNYTFPNLPAGDYRVEVDPTTLPPGVGSPTFDIDGTGTPYRSDVSLSHGQNRTDVDFGFGAFSSVGDFLWYDADGDGVQDGGEAGIPNVTLTLRDATNTVIATTQTDANGFYLFDELNPGTYTVTVDTTTLPAGLTATYDQDGVIDSTTTLTLALGENRTDIDYGYRLSDGYIGDYVWYDLDNDGVQEAGESGIPGVTVELVQGGTVISTAVTNAAGNYSFTGLSAGNYEVRIRTSTLPTGLTQTFDRDGTGTPHIAANINLPAGGFITDVDFGYRPTGSIGDRLWRDTDGDGVQDGGEPGLAGVTVNLRDSNGNIIATDVTDANGNYSFPNLPAGTYSVEVESSTLPSGVTPSGDLDGIATPNRAANIVLTNGQNRTDVDFGYAPTASVGDRVWYDQDGDGVQDGGEPGLAGITLQLRDLTTNAIIDTVVTDSNGNYLFSDVPVLSTTPANNWRIEVVPGTVPSSLSASFDLDGIGTLNRATFSLAVAQNRTDVDFGYRPQTGYIGDTIWYDNDGDGTQDPLEDGIAGVTVQLYDSLGNFVTSTATNANGTYLFTNLPGGNYQVRVDTGTLPAGLNITGDPQGALDSIANVTLPAGGSVLTMDFGYQPLGSIGNRIWRDTNGDGVQDIGETGIAGVTVHLRDSNGTIIATTTTNANGEYTFNNLEAGNYTVEVVSLTLPTGVTQTYDLDGIGSAHTAAVTLTAGQVRNDVDFGYEPEASLGDRIWYDLDGDGVQDPAEAGIPGVQVNVFDGVTLVGTAITDGNGNYLVENLTPSTNYRVVVNTATLPPGLSQTFDLDGLGSGHEATALVGVSRTDFDFGYRPTPGQGYIGDFVWFDVDADGVQDGGIETGIAGVTVRLDLLDAGGNVVTANIDVTVTNANGGYAFDNLPAGNYRVRVDNTTLPTGATTQTYDRDGTGTAHSVTNINLPAGGVILDVDFGYRPVGSIGDLVWNDADGDGVQDLGETGIAGVIVYLLDSNGNIIATDTTDAAGNYSFPNLPAGTYDVQIDTTTLPTGAGQTFDRDGTGTPHVATVTLATNGTVVTNADFGYRVLGSIGDRVWFDVDADGVQDGGEPGLAGVTVELRDSGGVLLATDVTDSNGNYSFPNLPAAAGYRVNVLTATLPAGFSPTFDLDGTGTPNTSSQNLALGQNRTDVDFGYTRVATAYIGDRVWSDIDGDGVQDPGEPGLAGVIVELYDSGGVLVTSTVTAANGTYSFPNLPADTYEVRVNTPTLPSGVTQTGDPDGTQDHRHTLTVTAGQMVNTVDFGYRPTGAIGNRLWRDTNGNGVDNGEPGIPNVTVRLLDSNGNVVATTSTNSTGIYNFSNLPAGTYTVEIDTSDPDFPPDLIQTYDLDGTGTANRATATLTNGQIRTDVDFGYAPLGSVGDRIWLDGDGDGVQDPGEAGINGVTVQLVDTTTNTVIATQTTSRVAGVDGVYTFDDVPAGNYRVDVVTSTLPPNLSPSFDLDGIGTLNQAAFSLAAGQNRTDVDFGYQLATGYLGDFVWYDLDGNGVQDAGESGIPGVTVELRDSLGNLINTAVTNANGLYSFNGLAAGTYRVTIDPTSLPAGITQTFDRDGLGSANQATVTLPNGGVITDVDFGYQPSGSIGDRIWRDTNGNGVDDAEPGIGAVTVRLLDSNGNLVATDITDAAGNYSFPNLPAGTYRVEVDSTTLPAGIVSSYDLDGTATPHVAANITLASGQNRTDVDFGYAPTASVGDRLWVDANGDGVQDVGEAGIAGATVELLDNTGAVIATTVTAADGIYNFSDLNAGDYSVRVIPSTLPPALTQTFDLDGIGTGNLASFSLAAGQNRNDVDFGYRPITSYVGDYVWYDIDGDGVQDLGESGIPNVRLELLDTLGNVMQTTTTNSYGGYSFTGLPAGTYRVRVDPSTLPTGTSTPTFDRDGTGSPSVATFTLTNGQTRTDIDFGYRPTGSLGDRLWRDDDGDGVQDAGEPGINGATVRLYNSVGTLVGTRTTNANGDYLFNNLPADTYRVEVDSTTLPANLTQSFDLDGLATPHRATATLGNGEARRDVDFGYAPNVNIGDRVWVDQDGDGVQDPGEAGIPGVTVELRDGGGVLIATRTTDGNGNYNFNNLPAGAYTVSIVPATVPPSFLPTFDLDGGNDLTTDLILNPGQSRADVDFGFRRANPTFVGDFVWYDVDADGVQDGGIETGIPGVTVRLVDATTGTTVATTVTNASGGYGFVGYPPGNYRVEVDNTTLPTGVTTQTYDLDGLGTPHQASFPLADGDFRTNVDFGYRPTGSIGDRIWNDTNGDGGQGGGEPGIPGVTVYLLDSRGNVVATTTTDANGNYRFNNLPPGNYTVSVDRGTLPPGFAPSFDLDGVRDLQTPVTLTSGQTVDNVDFGFGPQGTVGTILWVDIVRDDVRDPSEPGIPGVTVVIEDANGNIVATTRTNATGYYVFSELPAGNYRIRVLTSTVPPDLAQVYELDGSLNGDVTLTLGWGQNVQLVNFGYRVSPVVVAPAGGTSTPSPVPPPDLPAFGGVASEAPWEALPVCQHTCVQWQVYHTNRTGDWEIFRLGEVPGKPDANPNLSQGEGANISDIAPTRSPNGDWLAFTSNRDGNWEIYIAATDGSDQRRVTFNTIAIDTDPVWGPNNYIAYESTRDGNWEIYLLDLSTGRETRLTKSFANDINPYWSPDGSKLLFQSDVEGFWQIYELSLITRQITKLSDGTSNDVDPQYSNSGTQILFRSYRNGDKSSLYVMDRAGKTLTLISDVAGDATNAVWSSTDQFISYQSDLDGDLDIYIYALGTGQTRQLTDNDVADYAPTWICGSTEVIFTSEVSGNPDIFQVDILPIAGAPLDVAQAAQQLTDSPSDDIYPQDAPVEENASREGLLPSVTAELGRQTDFLRPDFGTTQPDTTDLESKLWQPVNGCTARVCQEEVIYHSNRTGDWEIFTTDGDTNLSQAENVADIAPTRSPDGNWIAFMSNRDGNWEIYVAATDGSRRQRVTADAGDDAHPVWSPNSDKLIYESNRAGNWELYLFELFTGQETRLTFSGGDERNPYWSPAGGSLVYQSNASGKWQLYSLSLITLDSTLLSDGTANDEAPVYSFDGEWLAFVSDRDGARAVYTMRRDGSMLTRISDPAGNASSPSWSPDGDYLAYESDLDGDLDIYVYAVDTGVTRQLTANDTLDYSPTWLCGTTQIIFTSSVRGNADIFSADALPIDGDPLDVANDADRLTDDMQEDVYPSNASSEENATREEASFPTP